MVLRMSDVVRFCPTLSYFPPGSTHKERTHKFALKFPLNESAKLFVLYYRCVLHCRHLRFEICKI